MTRPTLALVVAACVGWGAGCAARSQAPTARVAPPTLVAAAVIDEARLLQGTAYSAGGVSPTGFDCSGFVQYLYRRQGVSLPRTAAAQFRSGRRIRADRIRPGDLVFFRTSGRRISHVGVALGDGAFIHAPNVGSHVRIDRLEATYWARRFAGARRVTP